jgi:hypothetical protein
VAHLFMPRVEDEILDLAERAVAPGRRFLVRSLVARLTCEDDGLSMPNPRITASTSRVDTPLMYIPATASMTARTDRRPRSSDCGQTGAPSCPAVFGTCTFTVPAGVSTRSDLVALA